MKYFLHLRNLSLFILALLSIVRFGSRKPIRKDPPGKVLVVQLAKLGDMVCITPVLHALRKHLPTTKIYVLGNSINKKVLEGNPDIDEYIVFEKHNLFSTVRTLRREGIDFACIRGTGFIGLVAVLLAGIPMVVTSRVVEGKGFETRTYKCLLPYVHTIDLKLGQYMPRQFLRLLEPLSIFSADTKKHLNFSEAAGKVTSDFFSLHKIDTGQDFVVGVSPSAGNKIKEWPEERFAEVIDHLIERHQARVVLIGGPDDGKMLERVLTNVKDPRHVINTEGQFNIDELKALVSKLNLFISVDTGPIYIAEAFNVPTIDIVGPVDEREQPPQGFIHRNVVPKRLKPVMSILNARAIDKEETRRQTLAVTTPMVIEEMDRLISDIREKRDAHT